MRDIITAMKGEKCIGVSSTMKEVPGMMGLQVVYFCSAVSSDDRSYQTDPSLVVCPAKAHCAARREALAAQNLSNNALRKRTHNTDSPSVGVVAGVHYSGNRSGQG